MKYIRAHFSLNGENRLVAQEIRETKKETMGQQVRADINRDVRIALYCKRYEEGRDLMTGNPVTQEDRDEITYILEMRKKSNNNERPN
jgi:hypothetical protein